MENILLHYSNAFVQSDGQIAASDGMTGMLPFDQISKRALESGMARIVMHGSRSIPEIQERDFHSHLFIPKESKQICFHPTSLKQVSFECYLRRKYWGNIALYSTNYTAQRGFIELFETITNFSNFKEGNAVKTF
jgi:hypothetical protein